MGLKTVKNRLCSSFNIHCLEQMGEGNLFAEWRLEKNKGKKKRNLKNATTKKTPIHPTKPVPLTMLQRAARRQNLDKCQAVLLPSTQFTKTSVLKSQPQATSGE